MAIQRYSMYDPYSGMVTEDLGDPRWCKDDEVTSLESELERVTNERDRLTAELAAMKVPDVSMTDFLVWYMTEWVGSGMKLSEVIEVYRKSLLPSPPSVQQEGGKP